jgi:hypothetical protein
LGAIDGREVDRIPEPPTLVVRKSSAPPVSRTS